LIIFANTDDVWLRWSALLHDGKHPQNVSIKQGWTFHGHEFLGGKMAKKIFEIAYAVKPKDEIVQNGNDELPPYVLSQDMVTDSAVRRLVLMLVKMLKN
jgi:tRNA nucleotidyltransferase (CCA-adding enzyme)